MSDTSQGPGWWLASDGKWYPPELWTGPPSAQPGGMPAQGMPAQGMPAQAVPTYPAYPAQGSTPGPGPTGGAPYAGAGQYGPGQYAYGQYAPTPGANMPYGVPAHQKTNGLAIAALICGCAGLFFITAFLGIIFGFIARTQIKKSNGLQKGNGMALAGIIVGFGWLALVGVSLAFGHTNNTNNDVVAHALVMIQPGFGGLFG